MENSWGLLFYLKRPKDYTNGPIPIYFRITVNGIEREISVRLKTDPAKWSSEAQRINGKSEITKSINECLDVLQAKAIQSRTQLIAMCKPVTAENVKLLVQNKPIEQRMIMDVFKEHNKKMKELIGKDFSEGTMERYETSFKHTISFMQDHYGVSDIDIQKLDYDFISNYEHWLKTIRNCDHNTTMKYLSNFKKIVLICVKKKWLPADPFGEYKLTKRKKKRLPLSQIELKEIANKTFSTERLSIVRDIFIFSCYTGLAYADVKKLNRTDIFIGIDNYTWIRCFRKKTAKEGSYSNIPLLPAAENIIKKYWDDPACIQNGVVLPVRCNQKMNEYLKEIGNVCGINTNMTFHLARHTFATTVTLSNKIPIETVSRILDHQKLSTTQDYAQVLDDKVSKDMIEIRTKYGDSNNEITNSDSLFKPHFFTE